MNRVGVAILLLGLLWEVPAAASGHQSEADWHVQEVPECGFAVSLPGSTRRDDAVLEGGTRSVLYLSDAPPDKYIVGCLTLPPNMPAHTPAEILRAQLENHTAEIVGPGRVLTGSGVEDAPDGGRYWMSFRTKMRVEGRIYVVGRQIHDISGTLDTLTEQSQSKLKRMFDSYVRH